MTNSKDPVDPVAEGVTPPPVPPVVPPPPAVDGQPAQPVEGLAQPQYQVPPVEPNYGVPAPEYGAPGGVPGYGAPGVAPANPGMVPPGYGQPGYDPANYYGQPAAKTNVLAIVSLVSGIAFFVFLILASIVAIVTGHISLSQIKKRGEQGRGMAIAGLVLGYVGLAIGIFIVFIFIAAIAAEVYQNSNNWQNTY